MPKDHEYICRSLHQSRDKSESQSEGHKGMISPSSTLLITHYKIFFFFFFFSVGFTHYNWIQRIHKSMGQEQNGLGRSQSKTPTKIHWITNIGYIKKPPPTLKKINKKRILRNSENRNNKNYLSRRCSGVNPSSLFLPLPPCRAWALSLSFSLWFPREFAVKKSTTENSRKNKKQKRRN